MPDMSAFELPAISPTLGGERLKWPGDKYERSGPPSCVRHGER